MIWQFEMNMPDKKGCILIAMLSIVVAGLVNTSCTRKETQHSAEKQEGRTTQKEPQSGGEGKENESGSDKFLVKEASTPSPYLDKIGASLALMLTLRKMAQIPEEMQEIVNSETVNVSIRFSRELRTQEVDLIEHLGAKFNKSSGNVAHSGTIYGAEIRWDKIHALAEEDKVVRIEAAWQPGLESP